MSRAIEKRQRAQRYGRSAEAWAAWYLRLKGYRVLARNYRHRMAEIDVLAFKRGVLVLVEVKARGNEEGLWESVTPQKQARLLRAGEALFAQGVGGVRGLAKGRVHAVRFDIVWMRPKRWPVHLKDAWRG